MHKNCDFSGQNHRILNACLLVLTYLSMCFSLDVCAESLILCYSVAVAKQAEF